MLVRRRALLTSLAALALARRARADAAPPDLTVRDVELSPTAHFPRRFTLFFPTQWAQTAGPSERAPLLVLLHGLAETASARAGAYAWVERYGLGTAYERLRRPPLARTSKRADFTDARLAELNAELAARPFRGFAIACPYTPNAFASSAPGAVLDAYAAWVAGDLLARCRAELPIADGAEKTAIDGCSLGGFVGLEVFLRRPDAFGAWGGVQSAIGEASARSYADRLARALSKAGPRALHVETSTMDPYRAANERLVRELDARGVRAELRVDPGPHDQPWLREAGTIEMLLWHDRAFG